MSQLRPALLLKILLFSALILGISRDSCAQKKKGEVILIMSEKCPLCQYYSLEIRELHKMYGDEIRFKLLFSNSLSNKASIYTFKSKYGMLDIKSKKDNKLKKAARLNAEVTPEVIVFDQDGQEVYRGRIDNNYERVGIRRRVVTSRELREVLLALEKGVKPEVENQQAIGCVISYIKKPAKRGGK